MIFLLKKLYNFYEILRYKGKQKLKKFRFLKQKTIKNKILSLMFSLLFPVSIIIIGILIFLFFHIRSKIDHKITIESNFIFRQYETFKDKLKTSSKLLAKSPEIVNGTEIGKVNIIIESLRIFSKEMDIPFTAVHDIEGFSLGKGHKPKQFFENNSKLTYVKQSLQKRIPLSLISETSDGLTLLAIHPIYSSSEFNKLKGIVSTGYIINDDFALKLKKHGEVEILFFNSKKLISSSFLMPYLKVRKNFENFDFSKNVSYVDIDNKQFELHIHSLWNSKNDEKLHMAIAINVSKEYSEFYLIVILVFLFLILSITTSFMLAKKYSLKITTPINKLLYTTKLICDGDYNIRAKIKSNDELEVLAKHFNLMVKRLKENIDTLDLKVEERTEQLTYLLKKEKSLLNQIEQELSMVELLQRNLLPSKNPNIKHLDFASVYEPMKDVGGDFYDFVHLNSKNKIGIFISDVTGHGVPAAFITSMIKMLLNIAENEKENPSELLNYMNNNLIDQTKGNYLTAFYCIIDTDKKTIRYSRAGHNYPIIIRKDEIISLESRGRMLAVYNNIYFEEREVKIKKGDKIILYTDGLTEAINKKNEEFEESFFNFIKINYKSSINVLLSQVMDSLFRFVSGKSLEDDICIIGVEVL